MSADTILKCETRKTVLASRKIPSPSFQRRVIAISFVFLHCKDFVSFKTSYLCLFISGQFCVNSLKQNTLVVKSVSDTTIYIIQNKFLI